MEKVKTFKFQWKQGFLIVLAFILLTGFIVEASQEISPDIDSPVNKNSGEIVKNYFSWLTGQVSEIGEKIFQGYLIVNDFTRQKLDNLKKTLISTSQQLKDAYEAVEEKLSQTYQAISQPFKEPPVKAPEEKILKLEAPKVKAPEPEVKSPETKEPEVKVPEKPVPERVIEKEIVKEIIKEVEVSRVTKIEPIREITKEIKVLDDKSLKEIRTSLSQQQTQLEKLQLAANFGYISFPATLGLSGGSSITTLGTISSGVWQGSTITVPYGGTGLTSVPTGYTLIGDNSNRLQATSTLFIDSQGRVGIGTTNPNLALHVIGSARFSSNLYVGGNLVVGGNQFFYDSTVLGATVIVSTSTPQLSLRYDDTNKLDIGVSSNGVVTLDASSGEIKLAANDTLYTSAGHPIRKTGEEILRASVIIFRYPMPSQTGSTNFIRISKYFPTTADISLPSALAGTNRVYRLVINYTDDIPLNSFSEWRIVNQAGTITYDIFTLPGQAAATLEEARPYLTGLVTIPAADWQLEVRVPTGRTIKIFQIYLVVYDQVI